MQRIISNHSSQCKINRLWSFVSITYVYSCFFLECVKNVYLTGIQVETQHDFYALVEVSLSACSNSNSLPATSCHCCESRIFVKLHLFRQLSGRGFLGRGSCGSRQESAVSHVLLYLGKWNIQHTNTWQLFQRHKLCRQSHRSDIHLYYRLISGCK